jgi:putative transposase
LNLMRIIDEIYTHRPYFGRPRITNSLRQDYGYVVNHKRVYRLMEIMGIEAVFPKRNVSKPSSLNPVYPYLLQGINIVRPNQVWGVDITYIRMKHDWLYLVAIMDWFSRYVVSWELSDSLNVWFCCEALREALTIARPEIHNSDQGSHFTSTEYTGILKQYPSIHISMDHKGRCFDNIFVERLWRTIKYEEVYLKEYDSIKDARQSLTEYIEFYNTRRYHQALGYKTPEELFTGEKTVHIS